ncbi:O-antigen polymerase [Cetobacterium sp. NK01]|uniref:O-antigen polymerase n=1 Tax=Cetobacterium sp. NK01 TaxID=2993530 RepID=UPI0039B6F56E
MQNYKSYNEIVLVTNFIIILISIYGMYLGDKYNYSLNKIFYLFVFFFFGISPAIEFSLNVKYWNGSKINEIEYIWMNIIIIIILLFYIYFYNFFYKIKDLKIEKSIVYFFSKKLKSRIKVTFILVFISFVSLLILLFFNKFSLYSLLLRGGEGVETIKVEKMTWLLIGQFIKPLPIACLIIFKIKKIKKIFVEVVLLGIVLLTNFPTSSARFYVAAVYIPLLLLYISFYKKKLILNQSLIIGMLFLFPLLDEMRSFSGIENLKFGFKFEMFLEGHFDSYQNFLRVVSNDIVTNGKQLQTSILFFVPRKLWSGKSIGSGAYVANELGLGFDNISMNYFGEGYINFGYMGIIIFTILLAFINSRFDKVYWEKLGQTNILKGIYLLSLGMLFFILRGDLLSSFAYTTGILFTVVFIYKLIIK